MSKVHARLVAAATFFAFSGTSASADNIPSQEACATTATSITCLTIPQSGLLFDNPGISPIDIGPLSGTFDVDGAAITIFSSANVALNIDGMDPATGNIAAINSTGPETTEFLSIVEIDTTGSINVSNNASLNLTATEVAGNGDFGFSSNFNGISLIATDTVSLNNSGNITISSPFGFGGAIAVQTPGDISIVNSGSIVSTVDGIKADAFGSYGSAGPATGSISIINSGDISTADRGIDAETELGSITIENTGNIVSTGKDGFAIGAETEGENGIRITNSGAISATGENGQGITAEAEETGSLSITTTGDITTSGDGGVGITSIANTQAQINVDAAVDSQGTNAFGIAVVGGEATRTTVNVGTQGSITGGTGATDFTFNAVATEMYGFTSYDLVPDGAAGVLLYSSAVNTLNNAGTITGRNGVAVLSASGTFNRPVYDYDTYQIVLEETQFLDTQDTVNNAGLILGDIKLGGGQDTVVNDGTITGSIDLGSGANTLTNNADGTLNAGSTLSVGAGNSVTNHGTLSSGLSDQTISTTAITGNFTQSATGRLVIDIDDQAAQQTDTLTVSGVATLAGTVVPNIINLAQQDDEFVIISAGGGVVDQGLSALNAPSTAGYDFGIQFGTNTVSLTVAEARSAAQIATEAGSGTNAQSIASTLDQASQSPGAATDELLNAVRMQPDATSASEALERLAPTDQGKATSATMIGNSGFQNAMLSCAIHSGDYRFTREDQCYWARIGGRRLDRNATRDFSGIEETAFNLEGGVQFALDQSMRMGLAFGFEDTSSDSTSQTQALGQSDGQVFRGGLVLKDQWGPLNAYLNIAGSYGSYDHLRFVNLGGATTAKGEQDVSSISSRLRLSYLLSNDSLYVRPIVDLDATYVHLQGYTETGAGAANLNVSGSSDWLLSVAPSIELGGETSLSSTALLRPYVRAGVRLYSNDDLNVEANFANLPAGIQPFTITNNLETVFGEVEAGLQVVSTAGFNFKLSYDGRFSEETAQHAGTLKISQQF